MRHRPTSLLTVFAFAAMVAACSVGRDSAPAVATPSLSLNDAAAIGSPMEMTYRFAVAADAPAFTEDYWVFVHFLDTDDELMWTDDHEPPTPTRQWKSGATVEYPRTMFVPKFPYVGETRVEIGLFSPATGDRLPMAGETSGLRSYRVATFATCGSRPTSSLSPSVTGGTRPRSPRSSWGPSGGGRRKTPRCPSVTPGAAVGSTFSWISPRQPFPEPQRIEVRAGDAVVDSFLLPAGRMELRRIQLAAGQLGTAETVELAVSVDRTFVPASVPALRSTDQRELGIRVFRAFVQPS